MMRRRRRVSIRGVAVIVCLGSAIGETQVGLQNFKKPPPPPPRKPVSTAVFSERDSLIAPDPTMLRTAPPPRNRQDPPFTPPPPPHHVAAKGSTTRPPLSKTTIEAITQEVRTKSDSPELMDSKSEPADDIIDEDFSLGDNTKGDIKGGDDIQNFSDCVSDVSQVREYKAYQKEDVALQQDQKPEKENAPGFGMSQLKEDNISRHQKARSGDQPSLGGSSIKPQELSLQPMTSSQSNSGQFHHPNMNSRPPIPPQSTYAVARPAQGDGTMGASTLGQQPLVHRATREANIDSKKNANQRSPSSYRPESVASHSLPQPRHVGGRRVNRKPERSGPGAWKSIWGKVEKGLDELANLEDAVSSRAQEMISTVSSQRRSGHQVQPHLPGKSTMRSTMNKKREVNPAPAVEQLRPYGQKYEQAKNRQQSVPSKNVASTQTSSGSSVNWHDMKDGKKMLRANGGASEPSNAQSSASFPGNTGPLPQHQQTQEQQPHLPSPSEDQKRDKDDASRSESSVRLNPYPQPRELQSPPLSQSSPQHARRDSRIPWQEQSLSGQSLRPKPSPRPSLETHNDSEEVSWRSKLARLVPPIPRLPSPRAIFRFRKDSYLSYSSLDAWKADDEDERGGRLFGIFRRRRSESHVAARNRSSQDSEFPTPLVASLMSRCDNGKSLSLLQGTEGSHCRSIGRSRAALDTISLVFLVLGLQELRGLPGNTLASSVIGGPPELLTAMASWLVESMMTWAPYAFAVSYLTSSSNKLLFDGKINSLASRVSQTVREEAQGAQLYLRLYGAIPQAAGVLERMEDAAYSQVKSLVSASRLHGFVTYILMSLIIMTISVVRPMIMVTLCALRDIILQDGLQRWPLPWSEIATTTKEVVFSLGVKLEELIASGISGSLDSPSKFAFHLTVFSSLLLISFLPAIEENRKLSSSDDDAEDGPDAAAEIAGQIANLGTSSASRLSLYSMNGSIETALERWQVAVGALNDGSRRSSISSSFRLIGYIVLATVIAMLPAIAFSILSSAHEELHAVPLVSWDSMLDVSAVFFTVLMVSFPAFRDAISSMDARPVLMGFLAMLSDTVNEMSALKSSQSGMQFAASVSPTAGLAVSDLWAAHTTKRAWAVRGASLSCKNGNVLILLGDDGAGKSRLLTAIAESILNPPKRALTSNKVRGSITLGGLDVSKWDPSVVKRRLGLLLSDIRTVSDIASLVSGLTLEEILEPIDATRRKGINPSNRLSAAEKSAMVLGLKVSIREQIVQLRRFKPCD